MDATCTACGRAIEGGDVLYSPEGSPRCPACTANAELLEADQRAARNISGSAWSSVGLALLSFFFNPFFVITVLAVTSGVYAIKSLRPDNERFARHLGRTRGLVMAAAVIGIVIAIGRVALIVLGVALLGAR